MSRAFTRAVSRKISECALTHLERQPIDPELARAQHSAYEQALAKAGLEIVRLPELADDPDAVFVEDTAILLGSNAVITRPGAPSRFGEIASTRAWARAAFHGPSPRFRDSRRWRCDADRTNFLCRPFKPDQC